MRICERWVRERSCWRLILRIKSRFLCIRGSALPTPELPSTLRASWPFEGIRLTKACRGPALLIRRGLVVRMSRYLFLLRQVIARRPEPELDPSGFASAVERNLHHGPLEATTGKEHVPDNLLARCPVFAFADTQILRERNRPFSELVLRSNINQPGAEALNQIISKTGTSAWPIFSEHKLLTGASALSVGQSYWTAPSLPLVPPIFVHATTLAIAPGVLAIITRPVLMVQRA